MSESKDIVNTSVDRLLAQYAEYLLLDQAASEAKSVYENRLMMIAKERGTPLTEIATLFSEDAVVRQYAAKRDYWLRLRDRLADEMTFPSPLVWMLYKTRAYAGTPQALSTWSAFRSHCSPVGYICTKRYAFLRAAARKHCQIDIDSIATATSVIEVCGMPWMQTLMADHDVTGEWLQHEFHMQENRVAKWEDVQ